jgi:hypothetical protein
MQGSEHISTTWLYHNTMRIAQKVGEVMNKGMSNKEAKRIAKQQARQKVMDLAWKTESSQPHHNWLFDSVIGTKDIEAQARRLVK